MKNLTYAQAQEKAKKLVGISKKRQYPKMLYIGICLVKQESTPMHTGF